MPFQEKQALCDIVARMKEVREKMSKNNPDADPTINDEDDKVSVDFEDHFEVCN